MSFCILIMAGGTGGHVFPALAVADKLKQTGHSIQWMGTAKGIEATVVPDAGYNLNMIGVQGLRGHGVMSWLVAPFKLIKAVLQAIMVIRQTKPQVIVGFGGFASGPGGLAACLLNIPLIIHEQNAIPGLTNKLLARLADRVLEGFPHSFKPTVNAEWVGNPVRESIALLPTPEVRFAHRDSTVNLLVLGGSLGAKSLNSVLPEALALIPPQQRPKIRHQCGAIHQQMCQQTYHQHNITADITAFITDMAEAYTWADVVVCRAGALTIAELSSAGVGAILIPYPYAVDNHQSHNAATLVDVGAAHIINEENLLPTVLADLLRSLITDRNQLLKMATAARRLAKPEAASTIASICVETCNG